MRNKRSELLAKLFTCMKSYPHLPEKGKSVLTFQKRVIKSVFTFQKKVS